MDNLERVARAIARDGFGRDWDDFLPTNAHDTDQGDLMEYAQAAIAALEPVTVQEAARVLLDASGQWMPVDAKLAAVKAHVARDNKTQPVAVIEAWQAALRALAERGE